MSTHPIRPRPLNRTLLSQSPILKLHLSSSPLVFLTRTRTHTRARARAKVFVFPIVVAWIVLISVVGGLLIYALGAGDGMKDISLLDCIFLAASTVTASGLAPFAVEKLPHLSWVVLFCCMQLGSFSMLSLYPVFVRVNSLKKVIPPHLRTFDLAKYRRVPQWIVEYKALILLIRVVIVYQIAIYFIFILIIWARLSPDWESNDGTSGHCGCSAFEWAAFHGVSAYCNVGLSITSDSMVGIRDIGTVSFALCMLVLCGNVLFPMFIRWIIIALSYYSKKDSSRKVYFRYLLFNGGSTFWNLFSSQHTWLLVLHLHTTAFRRRRRCRHRCHLCRCPSHRQPIHSHRQLSTPQRPPALPGGDPDVLLREPGRAHTADLAYGQGHAGPQHGGAGQHGHLHVDQHAPRGLRRPHRRGAQSRHGPHLPPHDVLGALAGVDRAQVERGRHAPPR